MLLRLPLVVSFHHLSGLSSFYPHLSELWLCVCIEGGYSHRQSIVESEGEKSSSPPTVAAGVQSSKAHGLLIHQRGVSEDTFRQRDAARAGGDLRASSHGAAARVYHEGAPRVRRTAGEARGCAGRATKQRWFCCRGAPGARGDSENVCLCLGRAAMLCSLRWGAPPSRTGPAPASRGTPAPSHDRQVPSACVVRGCGHNGAW